MANGDPIKAGQHTDSTNDTSLHNSEIDTASTGLKVTTHETGGTALVAEGGVGINAVGMREEGLRAYSYKSNGIHSFGKINGIEGKSNNHDASGVYGENNGGGWGIAGRTTSGADRAGVLGENMSAGMGVMGTSGSGIGVFATAGPDGIALHVDGIAKFKRSGLGIISAGSASVTIQTQFLTNDTLILATLQQDRPGIFVRAALKNAHFAFTIYLNQSVTTDTTVAWMLLN
jgi:hypothetical protein